MKIDPAPLLCIDVAEGAEVGLTIRVVPEMVLVGVEVENPDREAVEARVAEEKDVVVTGLDAMLNGSLVVYTVLMSAMFTKRIK